ncbi:ABC transporter permease [Pelotomaculum terephthalicicum JT]|uniref:ABC transporter permease n=1 Tax=Pelotomaculum TaxID=191373 RepID=UPI0009CCAF9A|nr:MULTISPECIES: ABC transporter permease [Pelotomaculum]MCG9969451.1 ABC transporter permease [Pelotomaculum terephthalicicum JT]OPX89363.1 MAG: ABC-2 family transporter protein [Pelotomaculum sp. PtaB.Bin117]
MAEINPVLLKELRQRFRNKKASWLLALYLVVIGAFVLGFTYLNWRNAPGFYQPSRSQEIFILLSVAQLFLLAFVTPGLTAGAISGERERQTLNVLLTTRLTTWQIIWSKLVSSNAFVVLLVAATLPLYSIVFLYGGISPGQVAGVFGFYLVTMFLFGCIGVACSAFFRKTGVSTVTAYGLTFALSAGTALLSVFLIELDRSYRAGASAASSLPLPPDFITGVAQFLQETNPIFVLMEILGTNSILNDFNFGLPYWGVYTVLYLAAGALLLFWSARLLFPRKNN